MRTINLKVPVPKVADPQVLTIGIDPSSALFAGVCLGRHAEDRPSVIAAKMLQLGDGKFAVGNLIRAGYAIAELLDMLPVDATKHGAFIEDQVLGRAGVTAALKQAQVVGVLSRDLGKDGWVVERINNTKWRAELGIRARGTAEIKRESRSVIAQDYPDLFGQLACYFTGRDAYDQNLIDALGLALVGIGIDGLRPVGRHVGKRRRLPAQEAS